MTQNASSLTPLGHPYIQYLPSQENALVGLGWTLINGTNGIEAVIFTAKAQTDGWLGVGFAEDQTSSDPQMIGSAAVIGFLNPSGSGNISMYHLEAYSFDEFKLLPNSALIYPSVLKENGITSVTFSRSLTASDPRIPALNLSQVAMVWAIGNDLADGHYQRGGIVLRLNGDLTNSSNSSMVPASSSLGYPPNASSPSVSPGSPSISVPGAVTPITSDSNPELRAQVPSGATDYLNAIVGEFGVAWKVVGNNVNYVVRGKSPGYIALGFQDPKKTSNAMQFGEGVVGYLDSSNTPFLRDYRMNGYSPTDFVLLKDYIRSSPSRRMLLQATDQANSTGSRVTATTPSNLTAANGDDNNINNNTAGFNNNTSNLFNNSSGPNSTELNSNASVWKDGQYLNMAFTRPLNNPGGIDVDPTNAGVLWAVGAAPGLVHHSNSGLVLLNLKTGSTSSPDMHSPVGYESWIFAGAWIVAIIMIGLCINKTIIHRAHCCRRCIHKRLGSAGTQTLNPITNFFRFFAALTVIQLFLLLAFLAMLAVFLILQMYARNWLATQAARSFGWLNTLLLALVTLPINRRSLWIHVFGIPFERAVVFHRMIGRLAWVSMLVHLILMTQVFDRNIIISQSLFSGQTTPLWGFISFLCATAMAALAFGFVRRLFWELFWGSHLFFFVPIYVFAALHVKNVLHLSVLLCPLILYVVDALARFSHRWNRAVITEATVCGDVIRLRIRMQRPIKFSPGNYVYLNCPTLSVWQWHPFSISSPPDAYGRATDFTLHIKNMGPGTFTGRLTDALSGASAGKLFVPINIDAAYGHMHSFEGYSSVMLVAGGIGVTPMISVLADVMNKTHSVPPHIVFVWVMKKVEMLGWFDPIFYQLRGFDVMEGSNLVFKTPGGCLIECHIFVTETEQGSSRQWISLDHPGSRFTQGRPNMQRIFRHETSEAEIELQSQDNLMPLSQPTLVLACGPEPLVEATQDLAAAHKFDFQKETFLL